MTHTRNSTCAGEDGCDARVAGVVNLYKPPGRTSAHFVYRLRPLLGVKRVGHAGTLDPFADGVLLACVGRPATRLVERLMELPKRYLTRLRLGVTNDTFDIEQPMASVPGSAAPEYSAIIEALGAMVGDIDQAPPRYSAVRLGGVQSYKLARRADRAARKQRLLHGDRERPCEDGGASQVRSPDAPAPAARRVRIDAIDVVSYEWPLLTLDIRCGRGVYIRSIARDLGQALACGAVCEMLSRTAVGPFELDRALRLEGATRNDVLAAMIDVGDALALLSEARSPGGQAPAASDGGAQAGCSNRATNA